MLEKLKRQKGNTEVIKIITAGSSPTPGAGATNGRGWDYGSSEAPRRGPHRIGTQPLRKRHCLAVAGISELAAHPHGARGLDL